MGCDSIICVSALGRHRAVQSAHTLASGWWWMDGSIGGANSMPQQQSWPVFESLASGWRGNGV